MKAQSSTPPLVNYLMPNLTGVLWLALFFGVLAIGPAMMNIDGDLGRHITIGRYILNHFTIPTADIFSHSMAGAPLTPHEWLAEVVFALADRVLGLDGVVMVTALVIATTFGLVFRQAVRRSGSILASLVLVVLAAGASSLHWLTRPHIFTFLMLAVWVNLMEDLSAGKPKRWGWMPVVMLLWVNLHGAFIAGFVVWAIYLAGRLWERWVDRKDAGESPAVLKPLLLGGGASLIVTLANPAGIHLWGTSLGYLRNAYLVGHTAEYLSPDFHSASTWPFLLLIMLVILLFGIQSSPRKAEYVALTGAWMVMSLVSARNIPLFAIVAAPILAAAGAEWLRTQADSVRLLARLASMDSRLFATETTLKGILWPVVGVLAAGALFLAGVRMDFQGQGNRFDPSVFPVEAVTWLEDHPQTGEVFNYFPWGGYLLYREWPNLNVFIDGQTDFYGEGLTRQYEQVLTLAAGWPDVLDEYRVGWVILPTNEALAQVLADDPGWSLVYQDETAVILHRR